MKNEILLIPDKEDKERDGVAKVWEEAGGEVRRIGRFWIRPETRGKRITIYGNDSFCLVLAQILNLEMEIVKDEWIAELPHRYLKRHIELKTIAQVKEISYPKFIKSVTPKLFKANVFYSLEDLEMHIEDIEDKERLICSDEIAIHKEVRSFILNREIKDLAFYEGEGPLAEVRGFIQGFLDNSDLDLPKSFVLDLGFNEKDKWFIIEFNSSWGAGLNYCNPEKVMECIRTATIN